MTVECPACKTRFPVDPKKIPAGGVHARCSECDEVFFVEEQAPITATVVEEVDLQEPTATTELESEPDVFGAAPGEVEAGEAEEEASPPSMGDLHDEEVLVADPVNGDLEPVPDEAETAWDEPAPAETVPTPDEVETAWDEPVEEVSAFELPGPVVEDTEPALDELEPTWDEPAEVVQEEAEELGTPEDLEGDAEIMEAPAEPAMGEVDTTWDEPVEEVQEETTAFGSSEGPEEAEPQEEAVTFEMEDPGSQDLEEPQEEEMPPAFRPPEQTLAEPEPPFESPGPDLPDMEAEAPFGSPEPTPEEAEPTFGEAEPTFSMDPSVPEIEEPATEPEDAPAPEDTPAVSSSFEATPAPEPETTPEPTSTPLPTPQFGKRDPKEKAQRLARVLVSDIILYNPDRHQRALETNQVKDEFEDEIQKSWNEYVEQVGEEIARDTDYFNQALNEILAKGQKIF